MKPALRLAVCLMSPPVVLAKWRALVPFLHAANIGPHAVLLDVGANDGSFSRLVMRLLCNPRYGTPNLCCANNTSVNSISVVAVEPQPQFRRALQTLATTNHLCPSHEYEFVPAAAWTADTNLTFVRRRDSRASSPEDAFAEKMTAISTTAVPAFDLAAFMRARLRWGDANYLKLDVESS
eukprot:1579094-Prymnesium_polylepis.1